MHSKWFALGWGLAAIVCGVLAALYPALLIGLAVAAVLCLIVGGVLWLRTRQTIPRTPTEEERRLAVRALAQDGHRRLEAHKDLKAGAAGANERSDALRLWIGAWEPQVEAALGGDPRTLALFHRDVNTSGKHWIEVPVHQLRGKLVWLQPYIGGSISLDAELAPGAEGRLGAAADAGLASGEGKVHDASVRITDALEAQITRGPGNPGANEINWTTQDARSRHIHVAFHPRALRFFQPTEKTVREADLPASVPVGSGRILITRFFDGGVMVDEIGTVGDVVRAEPYPAVPQHHEVTAVGGTVVTCSCEQERREFRTGRPRRLGRYCDGVAGVLLVGAVVGLTTWIGLGGHVRYASVAGLAAVPLVLLTVMLGIAQDAINGRAA